MNGMRGVVVVLGFVFPVLRTVCVVTAAAAGWIALVVSPPPVLAVIARVFRGLEGVGMNDGVCLAFIRAEPRLAGCSVAGLAGMLVEEGERSLQLVHFARHLRDAS